MTSRPYTKSRKQIPEDLADTRPPTFSCGESTRPKRRFRKHPKQNGVDGGALDIVYGIFLGAVLVYEIIRDSIRD